MEFVLNDHVLKIRNHDNGIVCILYDNNYMVKKAFGLDKYENKVYVLDNFKWKYIQSCEKSTGLILTVKKYITKLTNIELSEIATNLLIKICRELHQDKNIDWMPIGDYYKFNGNNLITI